MRLKRLKVISLTGLALALLLGLSVMPQLEIPASTGPYAVGRTIFKWVDRSRSEVLTEAPNDFREVIATVWYPAKAGTGIKSPYFPELSRVSKALAQSGEVEWWELLGLRLIRSQNLLKAELAEEPAPYPVFILSPGNGTNVEFYSSLASEIASHGYIVVGLNHPHDVAAVELSHGEVAPYNKGQWSLAPSDHQAYTAERIRVRTADVLFILDQLGGLSTDPDQAFQGMIDLEAVAVGGHSLGGLTASEACKADSRVRACINFDGLQRGGPFSMEETAIPPAQPFLFMTKESELHPKLIERFESMVEGYWVVIGGAAHDSFTDGPLLRPSIFPLADQRADHIMSLISRYTLAFLDGTLKGQPDNLLSKPVHQQEVSVRVYPSN